MAQSYTKIIINSTNFSWHHLRHELDVAKKRISKTLVKVEFIRIIIAPSARLRTAIGSHRFIQKWIFIVHYRPVRFSYAMMDGHEHSRIKMLLLLDHWAYVCLLRSRHLNIVTIPHHKIQLRFQYFNQNRSKRFRPYLKWRITFSKLL